MYVDICKSICTYYIGEEKGTDMSFKNSLLSKLFGSISDKDKDKENQVQTDDHLAESPPSRREPERLEIPREHALYQLRDIRAEEVGWIPFPEFFFSQPSEQDEVLSENEEKKELLRLRTQVLASAAARLSTIRQEEDSRPDLDALVQVFLTSDRMSAWLFLYPPVGKGREADTGMILQTLENENICFGVDDTLPQTLPADADRYFHLFLAARGRKVVNGEDGYIEDLFPRQIQQKVAVDDFGKADYASLNLIQKIEKGTPICRIFPPTEGISGRTVQNEEVSAKDGKAAAVPRGRNTVLSEEGDALVASMSGHLEFTGRSFQVKPVYHINGNVDFSTGNIEFWGDVHVYGDVRDGFSVRATGTVTVDGVVESCVIESGGDLIVRQGIKGNEHASLRSHRNIYASYLEYCTVYVRENLVAGCILNCNVYADGSVQATSGRGIIIGGNIWAAHEVRANVIGSKAGADTVISLGGVPYEEFEYGVLQKELEELEGALEKINLQPDSRVKDSQITKIKLKIITDRNKLKGHAEELAMLKEISNEQGSGRLVCMTVYPGTVVKMGEAILQLKEMVRGCNATLKEDQICLQ